MNTRPFSAAVPICRKEICGGFPKMSWNSLSPRFNFTNRSKRTKRNRQGPPVSIERTRPRRCPWTPHPRDLRSLLSNGTGSVEAGTRSAKPQDRQAQSPRELPRSPR
jgi:hypothetical protein